MQKYLIDDVADYLRLHQCPGYAIDNAVRLLSQESVKEENPVFYICPKCGKSHPHIVKGGFSNSSKQMYRCLDCGHRFVYDYANLTWHSKQDDMSWFEAFKDVLDGYSAYYTAERLGCGANTILFMRNKIIKFLNDCMNIR